MISHITYAQHTVQMASFETRKEGSDQLGVLGNNELKYMYLKGLEQCLAFSKYSIIVSLIIKRLECQVIALELWGVLNWF